MCFFASSVWDAAVTAGDGRMDGKTQPNPRRDERTRKSSTLHNPDSALLQKADRTPHTRGKKRETDKHIHTHTHTYNRHCTTPFIAPTCRLAQQGMPLHFFGARAQVSTLSPHRHTPLNPFATRKPLPPVLCGSRPPRVNSCAERAYLALSLSLSVLFSIHQAPHLSNLSSV